MNNELQDAAEKYAAAKDYWYAQQQQLEEILDFALMDFDFCVLPNGDAGWQLAGTNQMYNSKQLLIMYLEEQQQQLGTIPANTIGAEGTVDFHYKANVSKELSDEEIQKLAEKEFPILMRNQGRTISGGKYDIDVNYSERSGFIKGLTYKANPLHNGLSDEQVTEILSLLGNGKGFLKQLSFLEARKIIKSALQTTQNSAGVKSFLPILVENMEAADVSIKFAEWIDKKNFCNDGGMWFRDENQITRNTTKELFDYFITNIYK